MTGVNMQNNVNVKIRRTGLLSRRTLIGGFLAAHGAMHAMLLNTPRPDGGAGNFVTHGGDIPLLNSLGIAGSGVEIIGAALLIASALGFLIGALLFLKASDPRAWQHALVAASVVSIVTLLLFWNDWMVAGPVIDLAIIGLVVVSRRDPSIVGA